MFLSDLSCGSSLLHEKENRSKSTGVHGSILSPSDVNIIRFPSEDLLDWDPATTVVLFPSKDAKLLSEIEQVESIKKLVVIDCKWHQVNQYLRVGKLQELRHVKIADHSTTFWRNQQKGRDHLATIEAIYWFFKEYALARQVEGREYDKLLYIYAYQYHRIQREYRADRSKCFKKIDNYIAYDHDALSIAISTEPDSINSMTQQSQSEVEKEIEKEGEKEVEEELNLQWLERAVSWKAPPHWKHVLAIDAHTGGEPLRVIIGGFQTQGSSVLERRRYAQQHLDGIRRAVMWEPRGHADMYGCVVMPPMSPSASFSVLFTHNEGYSTMCGHGIIAVATVAVTLRLVSVQEPLTQLGIDTPAGLVTASVRVEGGQVRGVTFRNVPAWVLGLGRDVHVPLLQRTVHYDLAWGGAFYAYVNADACGVSLTADRGHDHIHRLIEVGMAIKEAVQAADPPSHYADRDLSFLYGTIFVGAPSDPRNHSRNVCIFANGEVDRSPTGTGVSGRAAIHHAKGELAVGQSISIESVLGTTFSVKVLEEEWLPGNIGAVIPEVGGHAFITGRNELWLDPEDPLLSGFFLR